ncbi:MAG TPA: HD domain-containing protein [Patescibacteria group bacterium]|nr:HD domain-containing protein [Patescibacteria group bacterium]
MELTKDQTQKIERFAESKLDSLNWQHTLEVREVALKLARLEKADRQIVEAAALLHDIGKNRGDEGHVPRSEQLARKFLEKEGYEQRFVEEVVYCVSVHTLPWENQAELLTTPEAKVLFDADMIQQLSKFGLIKYSLIFSEELQGDFKEGLIKVRDTLFKCYNLILTKSGQQLAEPGYKFVKDFFKEL